MDRSERSRNEPRVFQIVANLDVESRWQRLLSPNRPAPALGRGVLDLISGFGTLLRAFADDDRAELWTPRPVDPDRLTDLLPRPVLRSGPIPDSADLAWGRIDETSARVNHRRFAFELSCELGVSLEGSAWVEDEEDLTESVAGLDSWVVKAPLSAAGRDRVIGRGAPGELQRRRLGNLLSRNDGLLVEPWLPRADDFGVLVNVGADDVRVVAIHRQVVDGAGRFTGIDLDEPEASIAAELRPVAEQAAEALRAAGYAGPASVDAWTWHDADGSVRLQPLGEINARLSFGWVARRIRERLGRPSLCLRLGNASDQAAAGAAAEPLLLHDDAGRGAAWIESV